VTIDEIILKALREDIGEGDHTSLSTIPANASGKARLLVKEDGILAGVDIARKVFYQTDDRILMEQFIEDGSRVKRGDVAFEVTGPSIALLMAERLVLNCMQRMSGIATYTHQLCKLIEGTGTRLMDTRKTTPNFRLLEKWAVAIGGGKNHRYALYDMVMLKDNHIDMAGGIKLAIAQVKNYLKEKNKDLEIEIETRTLAEVEEVLRVGGVDVIMLDNMSLLDMTKAVAIIDGKYKTEASGGITEATLLEVAKCGVDYISVGALTHSVKSLDLSLKVTL